MLFQGEIRYKRVIRFSGRGRFLGADTNKIRIAWPRLSAFWERSGLQPVYSKIES